MKIEDFKKVIDEKQRIQLNLSAVYFLCKSRLQWDSDNSLAKSIIEFINEDDIFENFKN